MSDSMKLITILLFSQDSIDSVNPLTPNSDQQQFSPNNPHTLPRDKVIKQRLPKRKCLDLILNSLK